ncbi:RagB/SusD family nutrient uptake outer membrane protein [Porphyromonas sp. COT-290 OH860]|uniref:RagB/SusD family nutrient uptake outer membrane protein n=1 Tax=Porphyromonas sp. COT-290 OH860 TaxID=1515615 RepID=UPI000694E20C|nr:RagB/SusD family nutrient uptake outer membrane protein [Porphyromonas sp. COT-290 OH860]
MNKILLPLALGALLLSSCANDFLSTDSTEYLTKSDRDKKTKDTKILEKFSSAALVATYNVFGGSEGTSHDDFGLKAFHLATDIMCEDMLMTQRNWFIFDYEHGNNQAQYRRTNSTWKMFYKAISDANIILHDYYSEEKDDPDYKALKSVPLAIRGISFFHLVNFYQHTYKGHEDLLGVPLQLEPSEKKYPRAKVSEVYKQIIADLTYAADNGAKTPSDRVDIDKFVAAAYLAKVYAQMEDWPNVAKYAAVAKEGAADMVSEPGRSWEIGAADILWGHQITGVNTSLWASYPSHMDPLQLGYAGKNGAFKSIHNKLYQKIPATDSRRKLFLHDKDNKEIFAKYTALRPKLANYDQVKYSGTPAGMTGDYVYLRVQDPILLEIEALNETGETAKAATLLNEFVAKRNPNFAAPTEQNALREEIRFQRRIELWGEGTNWFDMKRWKLMINRNVEGTNHTVKVDIATDAPGFFHALPQSELDANPLLEQNTIV